MPTRIVTETALALLLTGLASIAAAQEFAAAVSPPRIELSVNPGERSRQVIEIANASAQSSTFHFRTTDWSLAPDGAVSFVDELEFRSCRPWVAIERREITVPAGGRYRFRFEVEPPVDIAPRECRFAVMIEGDEQTARTADGMDVPVSGRIAVIVYVSVGGAAPDLQVVGSTVEEINGRKLPVLQVNNLGNAHGRLAGFLRGTDALGRRLEFSPATLPILPGETRAIALTASDRENEIADVEFPVTVSGVLEWGNAQRVEINQSFGQ